MKLGLAAALIAVLAGVGLAIGASLPRSGRSSSDDAASAAGLRGGSGRHADRHVGHLLPIGAAAFRDATSLVATAIAGIEAARSPAPAVVPASKPAPPHKPHPRRVHGKRDHGRGPTERSHAQGETPPSPSSEVETTPVETTPVEVEAPATSGEAPPAAAPAPQSPPPAATNPPAP